MAKVKRKNTGEKSQGELLMDLYQWSGEPSISKFTEKFNRSRQWAHNAFTWEVIPTKDKISICKAYGISLEYFQGEYELPLVKQENITAKNIEESKAESQLRKENNELKNEVIRIQKMYIELQQEINRLLTSARN